MFYRNCGKEIDDKAVICIHCGCSTQQIPVKVPESKTGMGVLMALFLGVIGLIIGICLYPDGSYERKTFIKAWAITTAVTVGIVVLFYVGIIGCAACAAAATV